MFSDIVFMYFVFHLCLHPHLVLVQESWLDESTEDYPLDGYYTCGRLVAIVCKDGSVKKEDLRHGTLRELHTSLGYMHFDIFDGIESLPHSLFVGDVDTDVREFAHTIAWRR